MAIQNIDFAKKIEKDINPSRKREIKSSQSKISWFLIVFFIGFTLGFIAGFQFFKLKHIEENLIKNPDQLKESQDISLEENEESNVHQEENNNNDIIYANISKEKGDIIILLGNFDAKRSSEIIKYLKIKNIMQQFQFYSCEGLEQYQAFRNNGGIYRIPSDDGKFHKIIIGCFLNKENAHKVLEELKQINKNLFSDASIFQIEP